ncbi:hypothetical protein [Lentibacillus sediminis]|uniref:hypothetical protein n=1 Tax=Lentibacillus sediminis TaxID=1940529 RepID=UPI001EFC70D5|nr:hypothetical protein [Lentibacillus sediminis]
MNLDLLLFIAVLIIVTPICLLLHEVGHGIGAISFSRSDVHIYLGVIDENNKEDFRIGRLHFHIIWGYEGYTHWGDGLNKWQSSAALAGGPIMSLFLVLFFELLAFLINQNELSQLFTLSKVVCLIQFIFTMIPITYPRWIKGLGGFPSDGLQLLRVLRGEYH